MRFEVSFGSDFSQSFDFSKHRFGSLDQIKNKALADFEKTFEFFLITWLQLSLSAINNSEGDMLLRRVHGPRLFVAL